MSKRIVLTGVGGFIGAHCLEYFLDKTDWFIVGIDSWRHKGSHRRIEDVVSPEKLQQYADRYAIYKHDLSAPISPQLENLMLDRQIDDRGTVTEKPIDFIINMASESAVERSAVDPVPCLMNNYELVINMLELARKIKPQVFLQISTDEVYGEATDDAGHEEWSTILPSNPYAASKAAQEAVAVSYWRTFGVPVVLSNCMNIIGEAQDPEKFLPKIIQLVATEQSVLVYAESPNSIGSRVYLHAKNKADALIYICNMGAKLYSEGAERPDRYNICGDTELNNLELAQLVAKVMGKELKYELIPAESARPGYDRRYALNGAKLRALGWEQPIGFEESIKNIVDWTLKKPHWLL
jgi:dTDP-glucose 4,6-dehydratase